MMSNRSIYFLISLQMFSQVGFGSGNVIGNGAGLVENQFQFAYSTISSVATQCAEFKKCETNAVENKLLTQISLIIQKNSTNVERLLFLSEKLNPGFFNTGENEQHRIAKTKLQENSTIYVNLDQIYSADGKPALDYPTIISILTHELGHQAGERNHAKLDILGNKLKKVVLQKLARHQMNFGENNDSVEILMMSHDFPVRTSELIVSWGTKSLDATSGIIEILSCRSPQKSIAGFEFQNGHFLVANTNATNVINFGLWVDIYCYSPETKTVEVEKYEMKLQINPELSIKVILLQEILPKKN